MDYVKNFRRRVQKIFLNLGFKTDWKNDLIFIPSNSEEKKIISVDGDPLTVKICLAVKIQNCKIKYELQFHDVYETHEPNAKCFVKRKITHIHVHVGETYHSASYGGAVADDDNYRISGSGGGYKTISNEIVELEEDCYILDGKTYIQTVRYNGQGWRDILKCDEEDLHLKIHDNYFESRFKNFEASYLKYISEKEAK